MSLLICELYLIAESIVLILYTLRLDACVLRWTENAPCAMCVGIRVMWIKSCWCRVAVRTVSPAVLVFMRCALFSITWSVSPTLDLSL